MSDFCLSDKNRKTNSFSNCQDEECEICIKCYREAEVKEFIKLLKAGLCFRDCGKCGHESYGKFITEEDIDKLAGSRLVEE